MKTEIKLTDEQLGFIEAFSSAEADGKTYRFIPAIFIQEGDKTYAATINEAPKSVLGMLGIGFTPVEDDEEED
jgi:hypothetical protein